jgi:hypothetical protein
MNRASTFLQTQQQFRLWDGMLAQALDRVQGGTANSDFVRANFYDPLRNGTYTHRFGSTTYTDLDTTEFINLLFANRASRGELNLAAWDLGFGIVSAQGLIPGEEQIWIDATKFAVDQLQVGQYDVIGLAGGIFGLASAGETFDPTTGFAAGTDSLSEMADLLLSFQLANGGVVYQSDQPLDPDFVNIQETAYTILALDALDRGLYTDNIHRAAGYLYDAQLATGGWRNWSGDLENNEITGEALWGLAVAVPEPSTWALLTLAAGAGYVAIRRRRQTA